MTSQNMPPDRDVAEAAKKAWPVKKNMTGQNMPPDRDMSEAAKKAWPVKKKHAISLSGSTF